MAEKHGITAADFAYNASLNARLMFMKDEVKKFFGKYSNLFSRRLLSPAKGGQVPGKDAKESVCEKCRDGKGGESEPPRNNEPGYSFTFIDPLMPIKAVIVVSGDDTRHPYGIYNMHPAHETAVLYMGGAKNTPPKGYLEACAYSRVVVSKEPPSEMVGVAAMAGVLIAEIPEVKDAAWYVTTSSIREHVSEFVGALAYLGVTRILPFMTPVSLMFGNAPRYDVAYSSCKVMALGDAYKDKDSSCKGGGVELSAGPTGPASGLELDANDSEGRVGSGKKLDASKPVFLKTVEGSSSRLPFRQKEALRVEIEWLVSRGEKPFPIGIWAVGMAISRERRCLGKRYASEFPLLSKWYPISNRPYTLSQLMEEAGMVVKDGIVHRAPLDKRMDANGIELLKGLGNIPRKMPFAVEGDGGIAMDKILPGEKTHRRAGS